MSNFIGEDLYPAIFSEGMIGNVKIRNKTVMCAMGCSASPAGYVNEAVVNHYVERAKSDIGLIIVEVCCVDAPQGLNSANMLRLDHDHFIPGMKRLADAIHAEGAKCFLQLSHTGRGAKRKITGLQPLGPSPVAMPMFYKIGVENEEPRELTIAEIEGIEDKFAEAARRAQLAGFDGVQIHSTGYYLGVQFLSRSANIRTDKYGGEPENRILFHKNVFNKIGGKCGADFPICIKATLSQGEDITFEDGVYYATRFAQIGFCALEVLAGSTKPYPDMEDLPNTAGPENQLFKFSSIIKGMVERAVPNNTMKFISGGRAHEPVSMNKALEKGNCDFVFLGKAVFAEPHMVKLIKEGRYNEARPCIGCGLCMTIQLDTGEPGRCSGNAVEGRGDQSYELVPLTEPKKVVVVGAGMAGVEAAVTAKKRGAEVILFEKDSCAGGQAKFASATVHKDYLKRYLPYFETKLAVNEVDVRYNTMATKEMILAEKPDVVICATGVNLAKLPIAGFDKPMVMNAKEVIANEREVGEKIVIIGGGVIGCETAELLLSQGKDVTVVEMLDDLATRMLFGNRCVLMAHLDGYGLKKQMNSTVTEIKDTSVVVSFDGGTKEIDCDTVIISVGDSPNRKLAEELEGEVAQVFCIGDSSVPDNFAESAAAGYMTAATLI